MFIFLTITEIEYPFGRIFFLSQLQEQATSGRVSRWSHSTHDLAPTRVRNEWAEHELWSIRQNGKTWQWVVTPVRPVLYSNQKRPPTLKFH